MNPSTKTPYEKYISNISERYVEEFTTTLSYLTNKFITNNSYTDVIMASEILYNDMLDVLKKQYPLLSEPLNIQVHDSGEIILENGIINISCTGLYGVYESVIHDFSHILYYSKKNRLNRLLYSNAGFRVQFDGNENLPDNLKLNGYDNEANTAAYQLHIMRHHLKLNEKICNQWLTEFTESFSHSGNKLLFDKIYDTSASQLRQDILNLADKVTDTEIESLTSKIIDFIFPQRNTNIRKLK